MLLSDNEKNILDNILHDLQIIFEKEEIRLEEIDDIVKKLKSEEVASYLKDLRGGAKPENALREELFAGKRAILSKFLFKEKIPERGQTEGFIDYEIKTDRFPILLELKPLFMLVHKGKDRLSTKLKQDGLDWEKHITQIEKYLRENEYLILTNLKTWFFFSKRKKSPILKEGLNFLDFYSEFSRSKNLLDYVERLEQHSVRGNLDELFFVSLNSWVSWLENIKFTDNEKKKELIIKLINKFIFIQTLDDYSVINLNWILNSWIRNEHLWKPKGELKFLEKFLDLYWLIC